MKSFNWLGTCALLLFFGFVQDVRADLSGTKGTLSLQTDNFISPDYTSTAQTQFNFIGAGLRTPGIGPENRFESLESGLQAQIDAQFSPDAPVLSYLNFKQLYHQEGGFSVGRKLENWSLLDERWNLGIYQPQFRWNPLRPESAGLTGVFVRLPGDSQNVPWGLLLFGSVLSVPDQGASYSIKDGQFEAANPWFHAPPKKALYRATGVTDDVQYDIQKTDTNKILFNNSFAAQFYAGQLGEGWAFQSAYAYKPSSALSMGVDAHSLPGQKINVRINPNIAFHRIFSADLQYSKGIFEGGAGYLSEKLQDPSFDRDWTYRSFEEAQLFSPFVGLRFSGVKMRLMNLTVVGAGEKTEGPQSGELGPLLPHRFAYRNANAIEGSNRFYWRKYEGLVLRARWTEGAEEHFSLAFADLQYQMDQRWHFTGSLLAVRAEKNPNGSSNLLADYENNDLIGAGVRYFF